ncbi:MAG: type II toxin-antitoxin system VapB family antitoxin [Acidobacteriota bacterium]|nr:type II toxin-antitoxin system VapB family antitoxin [Acidobacteriota bacterium]
MPVLNLKDAETYAPAPELAKLSNQTMTQAVKEALKENWRVPNLLKAIKPSYRASKGTDSQIAAAPTLDERSADEIIGYDEFGIPSTPFQ